MKAINFYLHMHQPLRYQTIEIGNPQNKDYWDCDNYYAGSCNERIFKMVADTSYRPMLKLLNDNLSKHPNFKFTLSITGTWLEQCLKWAPDVIMQIKEAVNSGKVDIMAETYYHSLSYFYNFEEFLSQVELHINKINEIFGIRPSVFRNTELAYSNDIAKWAEDYGFKAILAEGCDNILQGRSPDNLYQPSNCEKIKVFLKNYRMSDALAFKFCCKDWEEWPLTADKYLNWVEQIFSKGDILNIFVDFEAFGEHVTNDHGIFEFLNKFISDFLSNENYKFLTLAESSEEFSAKDRVDIPDVITWADQERDLSAWNGNNMQKDALWQIYNLREAVLAKNDKKLISDWKYLTTSDHFYYMCTKKGDDGFVHLYFSAYPTPQKAYDYYMRIINDIKKRI